MTAIIHTVLMTLMLLVALLPFASSLLDDSVPHWWGAIRFEMARDIVVVVLMSLVYNTIWYFGELRNYFREGHKFRETRASLWIPDGYIFPIRPYWFSPFQILSIMITMTLVFVAWIVLAHIYSDTLEIWVEAHMGKLVWVIPAPYLLIYAWMKGKAMYQQRLQKRSEYH